MTKLVSIVTPCYNEAENVDELCARIAAVMAELPYEYEHVLIDNASTDDTVERLRVIAARDPHVKVIVNARNFGPNRSGMHGLFSARGDAVIGIASDLQDPPELIPQFLAKWEEGYKSVLAVKHTSETSALMHWVRGRYYKLLTRISEVPTVEHATGAGLFDREILDIVRKLDDPSPYFRGLLSEIGYPIATVEFVQPDRQHGRSSYSLAGYFDVAMLGITNHSKAPLRLMTLAGFIVGAGSFVIAMLFLLAKLVLWNSFQLGTAPILIGIFFIGSVQLFSLGMLGEYISSIHTKLRHLPLVFEAERINFE